MVVIPNRVSGAAVMAAFVLDGGLLTLGLLAKPAQAKGAVSGKFPIEVLVDDTSCSGELIEFTGTLHTVDHFTPAKGGGYHVNSHFNMQNLKGVGLNPQTREPTGTEYVGPASGTVVENYVPASGQTVTGTVEFDSVISKGSAPNTLLFTRVHYILNDDGMVKAEVIQFHLKCQSGNGNPPPAPAPVATTASPTATAGPTAKASPRTGGAPLAMGAGILLVGAGLAARRLF